MRDDTHEDGEAGRAVGQPAEPDVFGGVVAVGEGEETFFPEFADLPVEIVARASLPDDVVEVVHRQLGDASLQGRLVIDGHTVGHDVQSADDRPGVAQSS